MKVEEIKKRVASRRECGCLICQEIFRDASFLLTTLAEKEQEIDKLNALIEKARECYEELKQDEGKMGLLHNFFGNCQKMWQVIKEIGETNKLGGLK